MTQGAPSLRSLSGERPSRYQEREIVRICNESEELKDLEKKLKTAYMNKEQRST